MSPDLSKEYSSLGFTAPPLPHEVRLRAGTVTLGPREKATYQKVREKMEARLAKAIGDERYRELDPAGRRAFFTRRYGLADADAQRRIFPRLLRRVKGAA